MRFACLVLLGGCSLVWGVDDYRANDAEDAGPQDAAEDVPTDVVVDTNADSEMADTGVDADLDSDLPDDARVDDADTLGCLTEEIDGPVTVLSEDSLEFVRVRMDEPGFAINIVGGGRVENVEVVLTDPTASGINVTNVGAKINRVRVTHMHEGVRPEGDGLVLTNVQNAEVANLELVGLPLKIVNGNSNMLSFVDIINVRRVASSTPVNAVQIDTASGVTLSDFHIREGMTTHAISCSSSTDIVFRRGYINIDTFDYPFVARGPHDLFDNEVTNVAIVGSARGALLTVPSGEWLLTNVQVERTADCEEGDYAFDTSMAPDAMLDGTASQRLCMRAPRNGAGDVNRADVTLTPIEPAEFCFPRTLTF